jgi:CelD/BcsL family acetyltransferase involved in cellulose biosynthesis
MSGNEHVSVCRRAAALEPHEGPWRSLIAQDPHGSYFMTPDWVLAWWETIGREDPAGRGEVAVWRGERGLLEAVVPLWRTRQPLHPRLPAGVPVLTLLGTGAGAADHTAPAVLPHRRAEVRRWIASRAQRASLWLPNLDPAATPLLPPGARLIEHTPCPRVDLRGDPATLGSGQLRRWLRVRRARLAAAGVSFRTVGPKEMTPDHLDTVLRLHRLRSASIGRATMFDTRRRALHLRLQDRAAADRGPTLTLAEREGEPVGAVYGFLWQDVYAYYQTGWLPDPELSRHGLGAVLVSETMAAASERGCRTFDFLRGTEGYKYRYRPEDRHDGSWLLPHGASGALLTAKHLVKSRAVARTATRATD